MTMIFNQSITTNYGVPATAWVIASTTANLVPSQIQPNPNQPPQLAPSTIRMAGYATAATQAAGNQPLTIKSYTVPQAEVASVFASLAAIEAYVLTLPDFAGATTSGS